ncbi:NeuD/PglB/VioB family sugar acetyltransferase [Parabacteroides faecis]|uniref:Sugar O-acyltransferase (Sialic acid O-acetyltransferase NeuD family) n=1 Tax=Parabacteroides faecis TaxID=1217282 RepID=A0ABR6KLF5_9BACT|nr:NeuD/PglB/VioB family sugar acetyltransferase [Parabacteroides faecis]MBB4622340.1 sugar O-acyltransferase (sialic acid O-acetyltransferase NeuD family) [Parabacteroides faecis]GGK11228.1 transferase [Parabacteroides faecis]
MKKLIIVGGGGMGRSVYCIAKGCVDFNKDFSIKGFIDDNLHSLDGFEAYPPLLGTIDGYQIEDNDVFVCSIGNTKVKKMVCEKLKERGAKFYTLIHKTAIVRENVKIGDGCIIAEYASVGADCTIGENCLIQTFSIAAHDCKIGNYVRIDTHSTCVGGVVVKDMATIHTTAVVSHKVVIGEGATVAAMSFVIKKVSPYTTVYGNPAKVLLM